MCAIAAPHWLALNLVSIPRNLEIVLPAGGQAIELVSRVAHAAAGVGKLVPRYRKGGCLIGSAVLENRRERLCAEVKRVDIAPCHIVPRVEG